jgi:Ca-activated chloride channel homolog
VNGKTLRGLLCVPKGAGRMASPCRQHSWKIERGLVRIFALSLILCAIASLPAHAKSAEDYYHGAAYQYIAGKIQEASVEAEEGLRLHPGDAKLRALAEQLRKMKDQQRGNSGKGDGKGDNKDKQDGKDAKDQKDPGDPKDKNDPEKKGDGDKDGKDDKNTPPKPGENDRDDEAGDKGDRDGERQPRPGQMSEEEAKRLLNSFADDEKKEQAERRRVIRQRAGTEQDW